MARRPATIELTRLAGTPNSCARRFMEMPRSAKVSLRMAPGWTGASLVVVLGDFNIVRVPFFPPKADSVLIVDPQTVLALAVAGERFEPVTRRNAQVKYLPGRIQCNQAAQGRFRQMSQAFDKAPFELYIVRQT